MFVMTPAEQVVVTEEVVVARGASNEQGVERGLDPLDAAFSQQLDPLDAAFEDDDNAF